MNYLIWNIINVIFSSYKQSPSEHEEVYKDILAYEEKIIDIEKGIKSIVQEKNQEQLDLLIQIQLNLYEIMGSWGTGMGETARQKLYK